jgi:hypothetical protein
MHLNRALRVGMVSEDPSPGPLGDFASADGRQPFKVARDLVTIRRY